MCNTPLQNPQNYSSLLATPPQTAAAPPATTSFTFPWQAPPSPSPASPAVYFGVHGGGALAMNPVTVVARQGRRAGSIAHDASRLVKDMKQLQADDNDFADVTFEVSNGGSRDTIKAHRNILAARSPRFKTMFSEAKDERAPIIIDDLSPDVFKALLEFCYTGRIANVRQEVVSKVLGTNEARSQEEEENGPDWSVLDSSQVQQEQTAHTLTLIQAASQYGLARLKSGLESQLLSSVNQDNALDFLLHAHSTHTLRLKEVCMNTILDNFSYVFRRSQFVTLPPALLRDLITFAATSELNDF
eukprot:TRINITY_DN15649_c0_g1_i1.p1 TRINITY_DN15649_c0_g1~~TRINITY_DN15649_c0_g1_i1.p1  ORF type:complete len:329 (+),score=61.35 TRINITY_DN15649_c0_g1_i1:85-987(+)